MAALLFELSYGVGCLSGFATSTGCNNRSSHRKLSIMNQSEVPQFQHIRMGKQCSGWSAFQISSGVNTVKCSTTLTASKIGPAAVISPLFTAVVIVEPGEVPEFRYVRIGKQM